MKSLLLFRWLLLQPCRRYETKDGSSSDKRYDLILAINGNQSLLAYKHLLAPKGICVMVGGGLSQVIKSLLFATILSIGNRKICTLAAKPNREDLELMIKLVAEGKVKPVIDRQYPLHETSEAVRYLSEGHALGKVMIKVVS